MKNTPTELLNIIETILPDLHDYVSESMNGDIKVLKQQQAKLLARELNLLDWMAASQLIAGLVIRTIE